jgi:hypothetical protein
MPIRTFGLNSREFYEAVCEPRERPWIPNGALPREPQRPTPSSGVSVMAETEDAAAEAFEDWRRRVQEGRIGRTNEAD